MFDCNASGKQIYLNDSIYTINQTLFYCEFGTCDKPKKQKIITNFWETSKKTSGRKRLFNEVFG